jgi:hypothetical protein
MRTWEGKTTPAPDCSVVKAALYSLTPLAVALAPLAALHH